MQPSLDATLFFYLTVLLHASSHAAPHRCAQPVFNLSRAYYFTGDPAVRSLLAVYVAV